MSLSGDIKVVGIVVESGGVFADERSGDSCTGAGDDLQDGLDDVTGRAMIGATER